MNLHLRLIVVFFMLQSGNVLFGQSSAAAGYENDLAFLKSAFESNYPSLYRFNSPAQIDRLFDRASRSVKNAANERDFYRIVKFVLSGIHDGHLSCSPSDSLNKAIDETEKYFPLSLIFIANKAYISCDYHHLKAGSEVLSINNESISAIRKKLFNYIVSDGKITTKKYHILNHTFWLYYNLVYGERTDHTIKTRLPDRQEYEVMTVGSVVLDSLLCKSPAKIKRSELLDMSFPEEGTAVLSVGSFDPDELSAENLDFAVFIDACFKEIGSKNIRNLVIDLRDNGGGKDTYGALLYSYLTDKPFSYYESLETVSGQLTEKEHPNLSVQNPSPQNFKGKVYIIINGLSYSVTAEFCTIAKNNNAAVFIGEETGGTFCGNTSGTFTNLLLPHSKITVSIPLIKYTMHGYADGIHSRGIIPEYKITPSIADLMNEKDEALEFTLRLINKNQD